jgi:hypothetical protein
VNLPTRLIYERRGQGFYEVYDQKHNNWIFDDSVRARIHLRSLPEVGSGETKGDSGKANTIGGRTPFSTR